jgi:hypothetical protein
VGTPTKNGVVGKEVDVELRVDGEPTGKILVDAVK